MTKVPSVFANHKVCIRATTKSVQKDDQVEFLQFKQGNQSTPQCLEVNLLPTLVALTCNSSCTDLLIPAASHGQPTLGLAIKQWSRFL